MGPEPTSTRDRILDAAAGIAREAGPGNLSLDAVAAKAGISKGGLLYHFPSKGDLLKAVVEFHLASFEQALLSREKQKRGSANGLMEGYLDLFAEERNSHEPPPSGLIAALAENPSFLEPVRQHHREMLDRLQDTGDPALAMVVFLAVQGVRSMNLLNLDVLTDREIDAVTEKLRSLLRG